MSNGYLLADTNSLVYAYHAGGTNLLDAHLKCAEKENREFAITETVRKEIKDGPLRVELGQYLADRKIPILSAPDTEQRVRAGKLSPTSAGEVSMLEVATKESAAGRVTRIWSDDKYFDSEQIMRHHPDARRTMSAGLLDEAYEQKFVSAADHQKFRAGYLAQPVFTDSRRLGAFRFDFAAPDIDAPHRPLTRGMVGGVALEAGVIAYEWNETRQRAQVFQNTLHNDTAASDVYARQGAQTVGMVAGTVAGGATATAVGAGTAGTAALVIGEAYLFGKAAEHGAELWQKHRVYNVESEGVDWNFNGRQWLRRDLRADLVDDGRDMLQQQVFAAPPDTARELSAKASAVAVEQALGEVPKPRDPFVQSAGDGGDPWRYQPDGGTWTREVVTAYDVNGIPSAKETMEADGNRAAQLSAQAMQIIDANLEAGPAEIAAQYEKAHKANGYDQTPAGALPDAVAPALNPDLLQASDGRHYRRDAQGEWMHDGIAAAPTRALELELTRDRMLPALQDHQQQLAQMPSWQPPTPEEQDRALLREAYLNRNIDRDTRPEDFDASYLAVQRTREATGVTAATTSLVLGQDTSGQFTPNSPIHHIRYDANGEVRIAATTTPEDIAKALTDVRARSDDKPEREREPEHVARTEAQPATPAATTPDPALAHRAATRDEHEEDRQPTHAPEQAQAVPALMTHPGHPAHAKYAQTLSLIERGDVVPAESMTQEEKSRMAAGVVAQFLTNDRNVTRVDGLYRSTHDTGPGMPASLIPVQGDPNTDYNRRASTSVAQALETPLEQSSQVAQKAMQDRQQELAQELAREQARNEQQEVDGPTMRIGPRRMSPSQGPQVDGGGGDGGGNGGGE